MNTSTTLLGQIAGDVLEWTNQTRIHPLGLLITLSCGTAVLMLRRHHAVFPFILLACTVAPAQRLVFAGLDFNLMRLMVLFGFCRVLLQREHVGVRWIGIDLAIVSFALLRTAAYTIQQASISALVNQAGQCFDTIGMYFLFRCLIRNWGDVVRAVGGFVLTSAPIALAFLVENRTGRNAFAFFGGVPEITLEREGRLRCQGAFAHPIIAGCFWATMLPMVVAQWWRGAVGRPWAVIGAGSFLVIILLTASSTPVMAVAFGAVGAACFVLRNYMRYVSLAVVFLTIALHLSMKAPVWHLISRITIAQGNTGYHRFMLIDGAIKHFGEWALVGTTSTSHWFDGAEDVTNQFILEGVRGGVLTLGTFVMTIWLCFKAVGRTWRAWRGNKAAVVMAWSLGVALFAHCTNFIAVSYFGQGLFAWYLLLAMIASMDETSRSPLAVGNPNRQREVVRRTGQGGRQRAQVRPS